MSGEQSIDLASHIFTVHDLMQSGGNGLVWVAARHHGNTSAQALINDGTARAISDLKEGRSGRW